MAYGKVLLRKIFTILDRLNKKMLDFVNYMSSYGKSVKDGHKTNAFAPLVWLLVFLIPCLIVTIFFVKNDVIKYLLVGLIIILVLFALLMYFLLLKKDPKLLQSEWYRLENRKLDLIMQQGDENPIIPDNLLNSSEIGGELTDD